MTNGKSTRTEVTDPRGYVRRVTFNADGYTVADARAFGTADQLVKTYDRPTRSNFVTSSVDALSHETVNTYDISGDLTQVTQLPGTSETVASTFTYDPVFHQLATITDGLNHTTTFRRNSKGSLTTIVDGLNHETTFDYNSAGQVVSTSDALQHATQFGYHGADMISVTDALGRVTNRFVDAVGRVMRTTDPAGRTTRYEYDALDRLAVEIDAAGGETHFTYFPDGQLQSVTDANNHTTSYTYDAMGRIASRTDALTRAETFEYDLIGNLKKHMDRKGQSSSRTYDGVQRLKQISFADTSTITYSYEGWDRLLGIVDSIGGTISRTYDSLDRLTSETTAQGTVSYTYDAAGRRVSMNMPGQAEILYGYDAANRLTQVTRGSVSVTIGYDDADRRTSLTLPNGVVTEFAYDDSAQLTSLTYRLGQVVIGNLTYSYDLSGNRTLLGGTLARTGLPPPISVASYDPANQLTQWGDTALSHDANGNRTSSGLTSFVWDARNELSLISGDVSATFAYDGAGRRTSRNINGTTTSYLFDGFDVLQELVNGQPEAEWLRGLRLDEAFSRAGSDGTTVPLVDGLGSTIAVLDSNGNVQTQYTYEPFGHLTVSGTADSYSAKYTGREADPTTGLYYYRARYYDPMTNRFTAEDPLWSDATPQRYAYAANNPIGFSDPLGLQKHEGHPEGKFKCLPGDPCELLRKKIEVYGAMIAIESAKRQNHSIEIADLTNGLNNCLSIYKKKDCDCGPADQPMTQKQYEQLQRLIAFLGTLLLMIMAISIMVFV